MPVILRRPLECLLFCEGEVYVMRSGNAISRIKSNRKINLERKLARKINFARKAARKIAGCFGIEAWNFNQHHLEPDEADIDKLRSMFGDDEVETFLAFRKAHFDFYFLPNG